MKPKIAKHERQGSGEDRCKFLIWLLSVYARFAYTILHLIDFKILYPKCNSSYIGKTDRTLLERVKEHAYKDQESAVNKHLNSCYDTNYLDGKTNNELTDFVMTNSKIIDSSNNWNLLLYKEALHIKRRKSILNNGLKASRELQLFN